MWLWRGAEDGVPRGGAREKVSRASAACASGCGPSRGGRYQSGPLPAPPAEGPVSKVSGGHLAHTSGQPCPCPRARSAHGHVLGGTHVAGLGRECIYKRCLQSKFHSILTSGLFPGALVGSPPAPPAPLPSGVLSLCHFVILAQTAIYGGQHFLPLFPLPVGPLAPSQKHSRALSNPPVLGAGEAGGRGPQLGPPIVHQAPRPTSPTPPTPCPTGQPWSTQWGNFQI